MDAYRTRIAVLTVVMVVAGLAAPGYGSSAQAPKPKLKTDPGSGRRFTSFVHAEIATGGGVRLKLTKFEKQYDGSDYDIETCDWGAIPGEVSDNSKHEFCYANFEGHKGFNTGFYFYYDILVPNGTGGWMPSGYWVDGATMVPMLGDRHLDCTIKRSGSTAKADGAPFHCATSWEGSGNTSKPHWKVTAKDVTVIDASTSANVDRAAKLIGDNCKEVDTPRCVWTRTQKSSAFLTDRDDWQPLTHWADSCPPATSQFELTATHSVQISWSDKVGGKISGKAAAGVIIAKIEATIEANYEHSITQTDSYGQGYKYLIPLGYQAALYVQHGMLEVHGDFSIITDTDRFLVKNAVFRFPLEKEVKKEGGGERVIQGKVQHVDIPCGQKAPSNGAPPPAKAKTGLVTEKGPSR